MTQLPLRAFFMAGFLTILSSDVFAQAKVIRASVSPEFPNGLHAKYLRYIASKMEMKLDIIPMPFGRRLKELEKGKLDLAVGLQRRSDDNDFAVYLYPSYEKLRHSLFVPTDKEVELNQFSDLKQLSIGVTTHAKYYGFLLQPHNLTTVGVPTLRQKIQLLLKGRIDTFIHFQESTLPTLEKLGLDNQIKLATYQPVEYQHYYVGISSQSPLIKYRRKLEKIIAQGVKMGDFSQIRQQHYQHLKLVNASNKHTQITQ